MDSEDFVLGSEFNSTVKKFVIENSKAVKFWPRNIGDKFPDLKEFHVRNCGITVVHNHNSKDIQKLEYLSLDDNKITAIEAGSFQDLVIVGYFK